MSNAELVATIAHILDPWAFETKSYNATIARDDATDKATQIVEALAALDSRAGDAVEGLSAVIAAGDLLYRHLDGSMTSSVEEAKQHWNQTSVRALAATPAPAVDAECQFCHGLNTSCPNGCEIIHDAVDAQEEAEHIRQTEMQEIADGAYGDGPAMRGAARDYLAAPAALPEQFAENAKSSVDAVPAGEVERLGDALFALSADLRDSGFFGDAARHANYERVVAAYQALSHGEGRK